ncbi:UNVERIFIED_CONTAM: hypothetical protein K2H54_003450 [Gekko kuhli]
MGVQTDEGTIGEPISAIQSDIELKSSLDETQIAPNIEMKSKKKRKPHGKIVQKKKRMQRTQRCVYRKEKKEKEKRYKKDVWKPCIEGKVWDIEKLKRRMFGTEDVHL